MNVIKFDDGSCAINGDATKQEIINLIRELYPDQVVSLILTDPPYGNIVNESWDKTKVSDHEFATWMFDWTKLWTNLLCDGGAFYVWGGIGIPGFRPFFKYMTMVEEDKELQLANMITWSKKRAYGLSHNYLFTREELAYFTKGNIKKPAVFNVPYLEKIRGYAGYNPKYPAKDERYRRTNVWTDITELFRGKVHPTQKPTRTSEIPIEVHTNPGDIVIDPFAGSGTTALAARKLGRKFIVVEKDPEHFNTIVNLLT